jgi:hypothetical protein
MLRSRRRPARLLAFGVIDSPSGADRAVKVDAGSNYWIAVLSPHGGKAVEFHDECCGGPVRHFMGSVPSVSTRLVSLGALPLLTGGIVAVQS